MFQAEEDAADINAREVTPEQSPQEGEDEEKEEEDTSALFAEFIKCLKDRDLKGLKKVIHDGFDINAKHKLYFTLQASSGPKHMCKKARALHLAIKHGWLEAVEYLLKQGADVHKICYVVS